MIILIVGRLFNRERENAFDGITYMENKFDYTKGIYIYIYCKFSNCDGVSILSNKTLSFS